MGLIKERVDNLGDMSSIMKNYTGAAITIAMKITNDYQIAQDVVQASFIKMWEKRDEFDQHKGAFFTWMKRFVTWRAIDEMRSRTNIRKRYLANDILMGNEFVSPAMTVPTPCLNTDAMDIHVHIKSLKPKYAECILLNKIDGFTGEQITKILGVPLPTVKSRVKIGMRELRKIYI